MTEHNHLRKKYKPYYSSKKQNRTSNNLLNPYYVNLCAAFLFSSLQPYALIYLILIDDFYNNKYYDHKVFISLIVFGYNFLTTIFYNKHHIEKANDLKLISTLLPAFFIALIQLTGLRLLKYDGVKTLSLRTFLTGSIMWFKVSALLMLFMGLLALFRMLYTQYTQYAKYNFYKSRNDNMCRNKYYNK